MPPTNNNPTWTIIGTGVALGALLVLLHSFTSSDLAEVRADIREIRNDIADVRKDLANLTSRVSHIEGQLLQLNLIENTADAVSTDP